MWNQETEMDFFTKTLQIVTPETLFYKTPADGYVAYYPKSYRGDKETIQSRNAYIGSYTEKWVKDLLTPIAKKNGLCAVNGVVSEEIELTRSSSADVALCKTDDISQKPQNILAIFEIKMSVVWNWKYKLENGRTTLECIGDYQSHTGTPGLLRSDSMLKAIGKSVGIRTASISSANIPIVVIGNTPIQKSYYKKVDMLKKLGMIQGFWSLNPNPTSGTGNIDRTQGNGFLRVDNREELSRLISDLLHNKLEFFASMQKRDNLGKIIEIANSESTYEGKATKFLELLREV